MKKSGIYILPIHNKVLFPYQAIEIKLTETYEYQPRLFNNLIAIVTKEESFSEKKDLEFFEGHSLYGTLLKVTGQEITSIFQAFNRSTKQHNEIRNLTAIGVYRFRLEKLIKKDNHLLGNIEIYTDEIDIEEEKNLLKSEKVKELREISLGFLEKSLRSDVFSVRKYLIERETNVVKLCFMIAAYVNVGVEKKLRLLQINSIGKRVEELVGLIKSSISEIDVNKEIDRKIKEDLNRKTKEFLLRRKLSEINKQLKDGEDDDDEIDKKIKNANLPKNVLDIIEKEKKNLANSQGHGAQANVIQTYIETLLDLPWSKSTEETNDLSKAQSILDRDHSGLEKVKKRILEFLAVRALGGTKAGSIICLQGPPGVGKTSLGRSIAETLNRKFERISLGGLHDEAELRGHRRTYVGAMPGVIIQTLKRCGYNNPVILLDEIDKVGRDNRGDPSAALLEILDPSQNNTFVDHYINVPFDLSKILFIATANTLETIQPALLDRLEVIQITGYTKEEKLEIAQKYLVPKQISENGLTMNYINFSKDSLELIINGYTREPGVRELERNIGSLCRNFAVELIKHKEKNKEKEFELVEVQPDVVKEVLGAQIYEEDIRERLHKAGISIGMAWTAAGGKILYVEAAKSIGKGDIKITGQLGEVMRESVMTALGWIKANFDSLEIDREAILPIGSKKDVRDIFSEIDIHVHFPAAAIPKDGPSAGITITTALVSLLTQRKVKPDIAMTGEITLTGLVLPVGGIKEKCLAAYGAGIKRIILPNRNKKDIQEISKEIKDKIEFVFVSTAEEVLDIALENKRWNKLSKL